MNTQLMTLLGISAVMVCLTSATTIAGEPIRGEIRPATPAALTIRPAQKVELARDGQTIRLGNAFLTVAIAESSGRIESVTNHLTGETHHLGRDGIGASVKQGDAKVEWTSTTSPVLRFKSTDETAAKSRLALAGVFNDLTFTVIYSLAADQFWIERQLIVNGSEPQRTIEQVRYGSAEVDGLEARVLELGKLDRPRIIASDKGGIFTGVGHWFYKVTDDGAFVNTDMVWEQRGAFEAEPWYVGVFAREPGEPYAGWAWYKAYLDRNAAASAKHQSWFSWNAGWGQWGIDIDDPAAEAYLDRMKELGIDGVIFGSGGMGKGIDGFIRLARSDKVTQSNLAALKRTGTVGGTLNNGTKKWDESDQQAALLDELDHYAKAGFRTTAFDFFSAPDTYVAHRNAANYFRAAHDQLDYTECHLGIAAYGPQFQRLVEVNHPDDIHGFDIAHFSADWATFLAFRHSRRDWQRKYQYLMPENGLYYFLTHYSNWGNPRRYTDPEPQQLTYSVHAYCGIGFNFHDAFGWRECIAAASAFTTAPVFGHIELKMPQRDVQYARKFFDWMRENASLLRVARVCLETESHCVVSKITGGKGLIYAVNYHPGRRDFELKLNLGHDGPLSIRQVYPSLEQSVTYKDGDTLKLSVRGESTAIFEVNGALKSLPPTNDSRFPIDLTDWRQDAANNAWSASFVMPDVRDAIRSAADPNLPRELLSIEQVQDSRPDLLTKISPDGKPDSLTSAVKWIGRGKLPAEYLKLYGFKDEQTVETWKLVPWAYADRVWFVHRPDKPVPMSGSHPNLTLNGQPVQLVPRIDYRDGWTCPLYYADITSAVKFGEANDLRLDSGAGNVPSAQITSAADRE